MPFSLQEVKQIIRKLRNNKACGKDNVRNEFPKSAPDSLLEILTQFFNIVLTTGTVPEEWCKGIIVGIFKSKGVKK